MLKNRGNSSLYFRWGNFITIAENIVKIQGNRADLIRQDILFIERITETLLNLCKIVLFRLGSKLVFINGIKLIPVLALGQRRQIIENIGFSGRAVIIVVSEAKLL